MATNLYFTQGTLGEQTLYEDLIIESLKMYGQDVYYIPREIVKRDGIFQDDSTSRFDNAYRIEMYIENIDGFGGEGDLFTKFGVEIREQASFVVARRRWQSTVAIKESTEDNPFYRPREGDLIYLPLSESIFEITFVETQQPFYQLKNLPVFRMTCELFEYNDEDFDTDVAGIDSIEGNHAYTTTFTVGTGLDWIINEEVRQTNTDYTMVGEVVKYDGVNGIVHIGHSGATDGAYHTWTLTAPLVGQESNVSVTPTAQGEDLQDGAMNSDFDTIGDAIIDFTESNPFGDPQ